MATCKKRGFVGAVLLLNWPGCIIKDVSAEDPGMMSGTCSAAAGPKPNGFLFTWMAKPERGIEEAFENVAINCGVPFCRANTAITPKPVLPFCPGAVDMSRGIFWGS